MRAPRRPTPWLACVALAACHASPPEPPPALHAAAPPPEAPYRPPLAASAARVVAAVADGGVAPSPEHTVRLELPTPRGVDTVAVASGARWYVAAVERDRVTPGLAGAERVFNLLRDAGTPPSSDELARLVGAYLYYPWRVWDGSAWTQTSEPTLPEEPRGATPVTTPRPGGNGTVLTFSYWIPDGTSGAGIHLAHIRVTDSGYLIDDAPNPGVR